MKNWIYAPLVATLSGVAKEAKAPWWALLLFGMLCLGYSALKVVFPQESIHRLEWWQDRRARKAEQGQLGLYRALSEPAQPESDPAVKHRTVPALPPRSRRRKGRTEPGPDREQPP